MADTLGDRLQVLQARYNALCHAMQSGVAMKMNYDTTETEPKHLRVGINSALSDNSALAKLLMDKGVITTQEYFKAIADGMANEVSMYEKWLSKHLGGSKIKLG